LVNQALIEDNVTFIGNWNAEFCIPIYYLVIDKI